MLENCVKSKNVKSIDDNEFVSNHWQCTLHSEKTDQAKRLKINSDEEAKYSATVL